MLRGAGKLAPLVVPSPLAGILPATAKSTPNRREGVEVETDLQHDLPAAWRMALRVCPYCGGVGECDWCASSGDLFGYLLERVYAMGRDAGLDAMRALHADLVRAGRSTAGHSVPAAQLKARLGI